MKNATISILVGALIITSLGWLKSASGVIEVCEIAKANREGATGGAPDEAFGVSVGDEAPSFAEAQCVGKMMIKRDENGKVKWFSVLILKSQYDIRVQNDAPKHHNVVFTRKSRQLVDVLQDRKQ